MSFPSLELKTAYQDDPTHQLFIEEAQHLWERVRFTIPLQFKKELLILQLGLPKIIDRHKVIWIF